MIPKDAYPDVPSELLRRPRRNKRQELIDVLVSTLENVEYRMSKSPEFNPWDLGPSGILQKVREVIALARAGK